MLARQVHNRSLHHSYLFVGDPDRCYQEILKVLDKLKISSADRHDLSRNEEVTIADARSLIKATSLSPHSSPYKAVMVNADSILRAAAQALLKSLEEPPAHTLWFLYSVSERNLPATIVSRCQRIYVGGFKVEGKSVSLADVKAMPLGKRFELAAELAGNGNTLQALDQWLVEVHNNEPGKTVRKLIELKKSLEANVNVQLQLEAFFYNL